MHSFPSPLFPSSKKLKRKTSFDPSSRRKSLPWSFDSNESILKLNFYLTAMFCRKYREKDERKKIRKRKEEEKKEERKRKKEETKRREREKEG